MSELFLDDRNRGIELTATVRTRILDAAQAIIDTDGLSRLTQPKVAAAAGVRQSHLTYYFPRRTDLLSALLEHSHHGAETGGAGEDFVAQLVRLLFDSRRARFFLAVIVETSDTPEGRAAMAAHMDHFVAHVAEHFGRDRSDPAIATLVAELRGLSMQNLVAALSPQAARSRIETAIARHGMSVSTADAMLL